MFSQEFKIGNRLIGPGHPPFVIAEMSGNHNQSLDKALAIVDAAAKTGAHALKLQTYTADTMTIDLSENEFFISDKDSLWKGESLYNLYKVAATPYEWHAKIFERCREHGMICFSTPFDETAVDFLETLKAPCYKIASFENNHLPLIEKVAATGKPVIISTGMADMNILNDIVDVMKKSGNKQLILLKCTSSYPATAKDANLMTIPFMRENFEVQVGLSDHTMGIGVALASIALGVTVIEKHFTTARSEGGVDSAFSMEPAEFTSLVKESQAAWEALGKVNLEPAPSEKKSLVFRRSIYVVKDVKAGEKFSPENVRIIRPGFGLPPKEFGKVVGRVAKKDYRRGTALKPEDIG